MDAFVLGPYTNITITGLQNLHDLFDSSNWNQTMNSSVIKTKKWLVNSK